MTIDDKVAKLQSIKEEQRVIMNLNTTTPFIDYLDVIKKAVGFNSIGRQGSFSFGVGVTDNLPVGMSPMEGTHTPGHDNYGNYQYSDGSIMVWIPAFYYRWNDTRNRSWATHTINSIDVRGTDEYASNEAAIADGFAMHRAFMDGGVFKDGFFIDKYQCSNNSGIASSIKNGTPVTGNLTISGAAYSNLNTSPPNTLEASIDAAKTRGPRFFPTNIFMKKALATLTNAAAQGDPSVMEVAWMDKPLQPQPRGADNYGVSTEDPTVKWTMGPTQINYYPNLTGSGVPFNKTTHNGQNNGVTDLGGNALEVCLGLTRLSGNYYVLKDSVMSSDLQGGSTTVNDAYGINGVTANYINLGTTVGPFGGGTGTFTALMGNATNPTFNNASSGTAWTITGAGIPLSTGVGGIDAFGKDQISVNKDVTLSLIVATGGGNLYGANAGSWFMWLNNVTGTTLYMITFRSGLYKD